MYPKHCLNCDVEGSYWCVNCKKLPIKDWNNNLSLIGEKYFDEIYCVGDYEDKMLGELIKACKYKFVKELCGDLGELLTREIELKKLDGVIVPVPLSKRRMAWRGFNQVEEIAHVVALKRHMQINCCLKRVKHKKAQAKLSEAERIQNMKDCFEIVGAVPKTAILVDDVITTGATINECAKILKQAGAQYITVLTIAKG